MTVGGCIQNVIFFFCWVILGWLGSLKDCSFQHPIRTTLLFWSWKIFKKMVDHLERGTLRFAKTCWFKNLWKSKLIFNTKTNGRLSLYECCSWFLRLREIHSVYKHNSVGCGCWFTHSEKFEVHRALRMCTFFIAKFGEKNFPRGASPWLGCLCCFLTKKEYWKSTCMGKPKSKYSEYRRKTYRPHLSPWLFEAHQRYLAWF